MPGRRVPQRVACRGDSDFALKRKVGGVEGVCKRRRPPKSRERRTLVSRQGPGHGGVHIRDETRSSCHERRTQLQTPGRPQQPSSISTEFNFNVLSLLVGDRDKGVEAVGLLILKNSIKTVRTVHLLAVRHAPGASRTANALRIRVRGPDGPGMLCDRAVYLQQELEACRALRGAGLCELKLLGAGARAPPITRRSRKFAVPVYALALYELDSARIAYPPEVYDDSPEDTALGVERRGWIVMEI
ncbi:hypothetical protein DFH11DRAFT_1548072 [Phellopilus nigrolimitatus]|nr:hypothetical protein DFH11DRAFT_1548072 [Phellopilus nigrolimitatus]